MKQDRDRSSSRPGVRLSALVCMLTVWCAVLFAAGVSSASEIRSRAAVVMDATSGRVLYAKNPELQLMPASTTKLMTALVVVERANLSDVTTVSTNAANVAPTRSGLRAGDKVTVEALLYAALMKSANDAAVALAEAVAGSEEKFVLLMNRKAVAIGAQDTRFANPHGLPAPGQHTTAFDLSKIMRQAIKHPVLKDILGTKVTEVATENGKTVHLKNTNKLLWSDEEVLGGKTGYTLQARHCFVCAGERESETLIVALLGAPSRDTLWKETEQLLAFGSKVMANAEEPVVYLTRADYDASRMVKASYAKKAPAAKKGKAAMNAQAKKPAQAQAGQKKEQATAKVTQKKAPVTAKAGQKKAPAKQKKGQKAPVQKKNGKVMVKEKKTGNDIADKGAHGVQG